MKNIKMFFLFITCLIGCSGCKHHEDSLEKYLPTNQIDKAIYTRLEKKFKARSLWEAPNYLGGLNPNYPISIIDFDCKSTRDTDWITGGFICSIPKIVIKKKNQYLLINNRAELKLFYAPITSEQEALSYAILNTRFFAVLNSNYFKSGYTYFGEKPSVSYVKRKKEEYLVHLFSYTVFGCDHPYYSVLLKVDKQGNIEILEKKLSFKNPRERYCVD